ncbi:DUF6766 family protein [Siphonobacter sp. SORGH_AS_0500]|uniref:DUF6766 family protein n=1 Tax=Siphonobacter sp. SORGH_AS_0500 TaxID=1864824 RepID=UPI000CAD8C0A|nr:DUF6766 family protein [Siphonobacter sp. SORGH_AS_0500]MDR6197771.1 hypothetical protein [Siphonobacter sp. SORGH_AS_0500]PKK34984.1 hypothetical protein BWI96_19330 [Siphonobacter sp. SORGH_AS_0500]
MNLKKIGKYNGLSIVLIVITLLTLTAHLLTGWNDYNQEREEYHLAALSFGEYLFTGHCVESVFENWESEFLQMGLYVVLTVTLYQRGSSESKDPDASEEVDREPDPNRKNAPWAVRRGGWALKLYQHSLSLAFFILFGLSFFLHALGGVRQHNAEESMKGSSEVLSLGEFMGTSEFWFQSFQNWQSEFLSVLSIVVLSIFLRQKGSPESKPVDASHSETGN